MTRKESRAKGRTKKTGFNFDKQRHAGSGQIIGQAIGKRLRSYYDHIIAQPVPDRFIELLKRLEERDTGKKPR